MALVTNYVLQNLKIKVRKKRSSLLAEPTFLVTLGTRAKSSRARQDRNLDSC